MQRWHRDSPHRQLHAWVASGQTLLVAHNIDLAPRISAIAKDDTIDFNGEYEWNDQGGVVRWTHHDPAGRQPTCWIQHEGRTYRWKLIRALKESLRKVQKSINGRRSASRQEC